MNQKCRAFCEALDFRRKILIKQWICFPEDKNARFSWKITGHEARYSAFDEPINHLDLTSIEWLETFLMNYKGTVVIVAHDRYFWIAL